MNIFQAVFLGIVQGLTEFLPISSSGHLYIFKWLFNWNNIPDSFEIALHAGTLLALVVFFFKDFIDLIIGAYKQTFKKEKNTNGKIFWYLVIATIPSGIIGYILDKTFEDVLTKPIIIAISLIIMGIILYIVDKNSKEKENFDSISFKHAFLIGLSQAFAFIPGVSRSGVTITSARALGVDRETAAKFSFFLSVPIIFAATLLKIKEFEFTIPFIIGVLTSFLVGLFVIKFIMDFLKKGSYKPFAFYRVIFGFFIIIMLFLK